MGMSAIPQPEITLFLLTRISQSSVWGSMQKLTVSSSKDSSMALSVIEKSRHLLEKTRVMTLAVTENDLPWSSPVYFVYYDRQFYFFSDKNSRHIKWAEKNIHTSVSVFNDSDILDEIFGFQMTGKIRKVRSIAQYAIVVKAYVTKFYFLVKIFGPQIFKNQNFFLEQFKSHLYGFQPGAVYLSDNSKQPSKRVSIDLNNL